MGNGKYPHRARRHITRCGSRKPRRQTCAIEEANKPTASCHHLQCSWFWATNPLRPQSVFRPIIGKPTKCQVEPIHPNVRARAKSGKLFTVTKHTITDRLLRSANRNRVHVTQSQKVLNV
jgi:hypothetical protein